MADVTRVCRQRVLNDGGRSLGRMTVPWDRTFTRIVDLRGPSGEAPELGRVRVGVGDETYDVDLSGADTVGDMIDMLDAGLPDGVLVALNGNALQLTGPALTVEDVGGGLTAQDAVD